MGGSLDLTEWWVEGESRDAAASTGEWSGRWTKRLGWALGQKPVGFRSGLLVSRRMCRGESVIGFFFYRNNMADFIQSFTRRSRIKRKAYRPKYNFTLTASLFLLSYMPLDLLYHEIRSI